MGLLGRTLEALEELKAGREALRRGGGASFSRGFSSKWPSKWLALSLEPIFEADFEDNVYAYRPGRSAHDALAKVQELLYQGRQHVVDADVRQYFDTIPHAELLQSVARRVADGKILR